MPFDHVPFVGPLTYSSLFWVIYVPVIWGMLHFCLNATADYALRRQFHRFCEGHSDQELREMFDICVAKLAQSRGLRWRDKAGRHRRSVAMVLATVLRERICMVNNQPQPRSYMASRRQIWALSKRIARDL